MTPRARSRSAATTTLTVVAAVVCVAVVVLWNAPANWLASSIASRTGGVVLLADADGTIWSGSAVLALGALPAGPAPESPLRFALPGRIAWKLGFGSMLAPVLHLTHDGVLQQPVAVRYANGGVALDPGTATLPASMLALTGAPLNTLRPEGRCTVQWQTVTIDTAGIVTGAGTLRVGGFALALSAVRPLGDYRVDWTSGAGGLAWQIATETGPLELTGNGRFDTGRPASGGAAQVRVVARAAPDASAAAVAQLAPLLDMIGRQGKNEAVIQTGRPQ